MRDWDEPAETLLALAPQRGVQLVMPRLGEAVEPIQVEAVLPWWRGVDGAAADVSAPVLPTLPKAMPWPID